MITRDKTIIPLVALPLTLEYVLIFNACTFGNTLFD